MAMVILAFMVALPAYSAATGATFYVSADGFDENDGTSPDSPWRTIARVNAGPINPGDTVLLRRGDAWREQLVPHSGDEGGYITYGAYGEGPKPLLLGSVSKASPDDWRDEGNGIWSTAEPRVTGPELLPNPSFAESAAGWHAYSEHGASARALRETEDYDSAPGAYAVECTAPGEHGSDIQLYTGQLSIESGHTYQLRFRARSSEPFALPAPQLMKGGTPWTGYSSSAARKPCALDATWQEWTRYYHANVTADDARLTFFLGGTLPVGATLHIDSLSFREARRPAASRCGTKPISPNRASTGTTKIGMCSRCAPQRTPAHATPESNARSAGTSSISQAVPTWSTRIWR